MDGIEKIGKIAWEHGYTDCLLELKELLSHPDNQGLYWQLLPRLEHAREVKKLNLKLT